MNKKICNEVTCIIKDILNETDAVNFNPESPIIDSGLNSLQYINMIVEIENLYDIELPDDFLEEFALKNLNDMCNYIEKVVGGDHE